MTDEDIKLFDKECDLMALSVSFQHPYPLSLSLGIIGVEF